MITLGPRGVSKRGVLLCALIAVSNGERVYGQATVTGSFKGAAEPGWVITGNAKLTSGAEDPAGNGWLRLTSNANNQTSFAYYNTPFPLASGFRAVFNYAFWGHGNMIPGDGIAFVLFDASETTPRAGAYGGSLGYAQKRSGTESFPVTDAPGLPSAVLGIGIDSFGWFATPFEGRNGGPGRREFAATIRGPGDGTNTSVTATGKPNYGFLTTSGIQAEALFNLGNASQRPQTPADFRQAIITVDTSKIGEGKIPVTVDITQGNNPSTRLIETDVYNQLIAYYGSVGNFPAEVKFGFTGGTGDLVQYHDIRLLTVEITNVPTPELVISKSHGDNFQRGATGQYSLSVRNSGLAATAGEVTVTDVLPTGLVPTAAVGTGWNCGISDQTVTCKTTTPLASSKTYPLINITVSVLPSAPDSVSNPASVAGGGDPTIHTTSDPTTITGGAADLTITKSHTGNFYQGQKGAVFLINVANIGNLATSGEVVVTDPMPTGYAPIEASGIGWTCGVSGASARCTRQDTLAPGASFPAITLKADVDPNAPVNTTNPAIVSGGGDPNNTNNQADDPVTAVPGPNLNILKSHTGNFLQGQQNASYTITVKNVGGVATTGPVTVLELLPVPHLTLVDAVGTGWTCTSGPQGAGCTRSDPLASMATYPPIVIRVNVSATAPASVENIARVAGGGDVDASDNEVKDPTAILPTPNLTITKTHAANFSTGLQGTYSITVSNIGNAATSDPITVTDTVPGGLIPVSGTGVGWACSVAGQVVTCVRMPVDSLAAGAAFPPIQLTVNVAVGAPPSVVNSVTVSGGGDNTPDNNTDTDITTIGPGPDLVISKTATGTFVQGSTGVYTIVVSNIGSVPTSGVVTVDDPLTSFLAVSAPPVGTGWTCNAAAPVHCQRADPLAAGASYPPVTISVSVGANAPTSITNTTTTGGGGDVSTENNTATATVTVNSAGAADLTISKTHPGNFVQGQPGTFSILVSNIGTAATTGAVNVFDFLPVGFTAASAAGSGWTCQIAATVHCTRSDALDPGAAYPAITVSVQIGLDTVTGDLLQGVVTNRVEVRGGGDNNPGNNTAQDPVTVLPGPDLTITKTHSQPFPAGESGTYLINVSNIGGTPTAGTVFVIDDLPTPLTGTSATGAGWTCAIQNRTVNCSRADALAAGASYPAITITVGIPPAATGAIANRVIVSGGGDVDSSNNTATDSGTPLRPDLTITKTHAGTFAAGGSGSYLINVSNVGAGPTTGSVLVTDDLPSPLTVTSAAGGGWSCATQNRTVNCNRSDALAAGASYPAITIAVEIPLIATGDIVNHVTVSGGGDVNTSNNTATDTGTPLRPDLRIEKQHSGTFTPGGTGSYTITVTNGGGSPTAGQVMVSDSVPAEFKPTAVAGSGWSCATQGQLVACSRSDALAAGASYPSISLTVEIATGVTGSITNLVTVTGGGECTAATGSAADCDPNNTGRDVVNFDGPRPAGPLRCIVSAVPPIVRREGLTELTGDIILQCTGGTPTPANTPISKSNVQIFLNTNITSRLNAAAGFSEALLLVDEPQPAAGSQVPSGLPVPPGAGTQRLCAFGQDITGTGDGAGTYDGSSANHCNMFLAQQAGVSSVLFAGVPIDPPGTGTRLIRITNIRANASQLGDSATLVPSQVVAFVSATPSTSLPLTTAQVTVGFISQGIAVSAGDLVNLQQCVSRNTDLNTMISQFNVTVKEGFATSFSRRTYARSTDTSISPDPSPQNIPGFQYHTESGFYNPAVLGTAGLADFGSRIIVRFENVGAGATLYVPTVISLRFAEGPSGVSGTLRLLNSTNTGAGAFSPATATATLNGAPAAPLTSSGGAAWAVYEVLNSNETSLDFATIPVAVSYVGDATTKLPGAGVTSVSGSFAPLNTTGIADSGSPIPRFTGSSVLNPVFAIQTCNCTLLFPFVTNQAGFDTGIAIANTSKDPLGTPAQSGPVTVSYFGGTTGGGAAPAAQVSQVVGAGQTVTFSLSTGGGFGMAATPTFQGYIIVKAEFQYCHGFAAISDFGTNRISESYLGLVMDSAIASRGVNQSETLGH